MKTLVVCDSVYGNTAQIARAITGALGPPDDVQMRQVSEVDVTSLAALDLLIVGAPTHGGRPSPTMQEFLNKIPANALRNVDVAAFDTRLSAEGRGFWMRMLLSILGYAAGHIAKGLTRKGGKLVAPAEGFIVEDKEGPLKDGELERAAVWARSIQGAMQTLQYAA